MVNSVVFVNFIICIFLITLTTSVLRQHGPGGLEDNETTTCDEFSQYARFNPYSVLDSEWMVFYYWGPPQNTLLYKFYVPGENETAYLKKLLEGKVEKPINWTTKFVLMREKFNNTCLLVERNDRGEYDLYTLYGFKKNDIIEATDVRIKQSGDNRYIGIMSCETEVVYVMARVKDVPPKKMIQDVVARLGYRGRGGKSYLYQGHQWMPIPEANEQLYWQRSKLRQWYLYE